MICVYKTENVCPNAIRFDLDGNIVKNIEFIGGGCPGNLRALVKLVDGMTTEEINKKLSGITCGRKNTSCPNELAKAVKQAKIKELV